MSAGDHQLQAVRDGYPDCPECKSDVFVGRFNNPSIVEFVCYCCNLKFDRSDTS